MSTTLRLGKAEIVRALREIADLLEIAEANDFEVMAYRNASRSLDEWSGDFPSAVRDQSLTEIPSLGKGIAQVITDLANTGGSPARESARAAVPVELPQLLRISGLGPKRVRALWRELDIESPAQLRTVAEQGRLMSLRGFGAKTVERILSGLERLENPRPRPPAPQPPAIAAAARPSGRIWAGTSGFSYPQWKGSFYPAEAKTDELLPLYADRLPTVEINNTFYRFPSSQVIDQWLSQTPGTFQFAVKAHRRITHTLQLSADSKQTIIDFVHRCALLEGRLGCILFQLPPKLARDEVRLELLLNTLPVGPRYAVEFRHGSWLVDEVLEKLTERNVACVAGDAPDVEPQRWTTADFVYVRLRRNQYNSSDLAEWDEWFAEQTAAGRDVWVFLKHDEEGAAPQAVLDRWTEPRSPAKQRLERQLAKPARAQPTKRKRRSGKTA